MSDNAFWWPLAIVAVGWAWAVWAWRDAKNAASHYTENANRRYQAWRARTVECPQCGGLGRVEEES